jgi:hypothetical protein
MRSSFDKMWTVTHELDRGWSYQAFESRYNRRLTAHLLISAAAGELSVEVPVYEVAVQKLKLIL